MPTVYYGLRLHYTILQAAERRREEQQGVQLPASPEVVSEQFVEVPMEESDDSIEDNVS